jgi:predicted RNA polymerase sigma factor
MRDGDAAATAEAVARRSYGKLVAFLAARTRDVAAAEDALSEAFAAALADWPKSGIPESPEGWLMTAAKRKLIDTARRGKTRDAAEPQLTLIAEELGEMATLEKDGHDIPDKRLALMFACAHPAIEEVIRAPLILQTVMGLSANAIASAFLTSPAAMAKRLVRAKEKIRDAGIPFEVPGREELGPRLSAVLDAIYATFSEGWSNPSDFDDVRRDLTGESLFLARLTIELMPEESEALCLAALMFHAEARRAARRDDTGQYVPLAEQDVALWNIELISEADTLIQLAGGMEGLGRYELEAALQSAHALRRLTGRNNWAEIVALYDALLAMQGSPVVAINRALAIAEIDGPGAALDAMPSAESDARLANYQPYWAARAELLVRWGATAEASQAYDLAIGLERDPAVRTFLLKRKARLGN